jgi:glucosylglycerate synthase
VTSLFSDELLSELMAVGQVDVVVGLPTLNHSDSVGPVVRAAHVAFNRELARERTVLLNVDGGSTDGTPDIVRDASIIDRETFVAAQSLRTHHRISAPYHGVPGKATAVRTVFAAADLLQARAVAVLDPEIASVTPESVASLVRPALAAGADFVSPAYARHPLDGPLVTQLVRPLFRAAYGLRLREPLAGEFGCSGRFAAACLERPEWDTDVLREGIDLWISAVAATDGFRVVETSLGPRHLAARSRPGIAALVPQVLGALFACLKLHEAVWTTRTGSEPVALHGAPVPVPQLESAPDPTGAADLFKDGLAALSGLLTSVLQPATLEGLRHTAAGDGDLVLSDELWVKVVAELAAAYRRAVVSREHLVRMAVPLYLGRLASFAASVSGESPGTIEEALEDLCLRFEQFKPELVALWTAPAS